MKLSVIPIAALFASISTSLAAPASLKPRACTNPVLRKEWRTATAAEKTSYTKAVLCLATKPSRIGRNTTLYDDFAWVHQDLGTPIHNHAQFLPWHRYFMHVYEQALKGCGYTGAMMYWDWVKDSAAPASSPVWSLTNGFGGNGVDTTVFLKRCISGPFASLRPAYFNNQYMPHCVNRNFAPGYPEGGQQEMVGFNYDPSIMASVNANTMYTTFHPSLEQTPHSAVHYGVSQRDADMGPLTSPNDPIFFLHHTQVDRVWWLWQQQNPAGRTYDYGGFDYDMATGNDVPATLNTLMLMEGLAPNRKVRDFMSTTTNDLCYKY